MAVLQLSGTDSVPLASHASTVTAAHFGVNLVAAYVPSTLGQFTGSGLSDAVADLGAGSIRYPGGTVTEQLFDPRHENSTLQGGGKMIAQSEAIAFAAHTGATLDIVLQTRTGFTATAAQALRDGTYGARQVSADYLDMTYAYITRTLRDATAAGVQISTFEIGNEFFYSGEMTATEYGQLTRAVLQVAQAAIDAVLPPGVPDPLLLVQTLSAAGRFSPRDATKVWISGDQISFEAKDGWMVRTMAATGSAAAQAQQIADQITGAAKGQPNLSHLVDGLIGHDYNSRGHRTDGSQAEPYLFSQFDRQEARLGFAAGTLSRNVTEWNATALVDVDGNGTNDPQAALNRGLPHAAVLVEMFYQFIEKGVDAATIWPAYFPGGNTTNLLDSSDYSQRIPGAMFTLMQESLVGLTVAFDSHDSGAGYALDTHAFADASRIVLFVASRNAAATGPVTLDLSDGFNGAAQHKLSSGTYFLVETELGAQNAAGRATAVLNNAETRPFLSYTNGAMAVGDDITFDSLGGYGMLRIEATFVGAGADRVEGRGGHDSIVGLGGNDILLGNDGNDRLDGMEGDDRLYGGAGNDRLVGDIGRDILCGGLGDDSLRGDTQDDQLSGDDGNDLIHGGAGNDRLSGGNGNDRLFGNDGNDYLSGGAGNDTLEGGRGTDTLSGGRQPDTFVFADRFGSDLITDFRVSGADRIDVSRMTGVNDVTGMADLRQHMAAVGDDMVITFGNDVLTISNAAGYGFTSADFLF